MPELAWMKFNTNGHVIDEIEWLRRGDMQCAGCETYVWHWGSENDAPCKIEEERAKLEADCKFWKNPGI